MKMFITCLSVYIGNIFSFLSFRALYCTLIFIRPFTVHVLFSTVRVVQLITLLGEKGIAIIIQVVVFASKYALCGSIAKRGVSVEEIIMKSVTDFQADFQAFPCTSFIHLQLRVY
jgi:hypothetical protein